MLKPSFRNLLLTAAYGAFIAYGNPDVPSQAVLGGRSQPEVVYTSPLPNQAEVELDASVVVQFNRPMDRGSVERAFRISPGIDGAFTWDRPSRALIFDPAGELRPGTRYTVTIGPEAHTAGRGLDGKDRPTLRLSEPYVLSFDTLGATTVLIDVSHGSALAYSHRVAFASLATLLDDNGYEVDFSEVPLADALQGDSDVVVLALPRNSYTDQEIAALEQYVSGGGQLILLGEFNHMMGTSHLQKVATRFGLGFDRNVLYDTNNNVSGRSYWPATSALSPVAAASGRVGSTAYFAAASVHGGEPLVMAEGSAYSVGSRVGSGPLVIGSRAAYGEGSVTILGDNDFGADSRLPLGTGLRYHDNCHFALYLFGGGECTLD